MRGLSGANAQSFQIGFVGEPLPGHEQYRGRLAVPYLTRAGVVTIRFRCIWTIDHPTEEKCTGHAKFLSFAGDVPRVYNPAALHRATDFVCIAEGEPDTWIAEQCGLPTVGIPGVATLREYTPRLFAGYKTVYGLVDNDDGGQGQEFADKLGTLIPQYRPILMPKGHDVNSLVLEQGPNALLNRLDIRL